MMDAMDKYQREMAARVAARLAQIAADAADLPMDRDQILEGARACYAELDAGIREGDGVRTRAARQRLDALAYNLAGKDHGESYRAEREIEDYLAPQPGEVPTWGLNGEFLAVVDGIKVRCEKLGAHLSLRAVDAGAPFLSPTGLRSCLNGLFGGGDVMTSTIATIRKVLNEDGRHGIEARYRQHIVESQPQWVAGALARLGDQQVSYQDGLQMAFAF